MIFYSNEDVDIFGNLIYKKLYRSGKFRQILKEIDICRIRDYNINTNKTEIYNYNFQSPDKKFFDFSKKNWYHDYCNGWFYNTLENYWYKVYLCYLLRKKYKFFFFY